MAMNERERECILVATHATRIIRECGRVREQEVVAYSRSGNGKRVHAVVCMSACVHAYMGERSLVCECVHTWNHAPNT